MAVSLYILQDIVENGVYSAIPFFWSVYSSTSIRGGGWLFEVKVLLNPGSQVVFSLSLLLCIYLSIFQSLSLFYMLIALSFSHLNLYLSISDEF